MTDLEVFQFPATGQEIRTLVRHGEPWFIGRDACDVLAITNHRSSLARLDADERDVHTVDSPSGQQEYIVISESGLYSLILRSRRPEAKAFKRWITHDVLPAIRKTGSYGPERRLSPRDLAQLVIEEADRADRNAERADKAEVAVAQQAKQLESAQPKADYVDSFVNATGDVTTIKEYGVQVAMSENDLRAYLVANNVISRREMWRRTSRGNRERVWQWVARTKYLTWFTSRDQPDAPRLHNGQLQSTLYVNAVGKQRIKELLERKPFAAIEAPKAELSKTKGK